MEEADLIDLVRSALGAREVHELRRFVCYLSEPDGGAVRVDAELLYGGTASPNVFLFRAESEDGTKRWAGNSHESARAAILGSHRV